MKHLVQAAAAFAIVAAAGSTAFAGDYPAPTPLAEGAQAPISAIHKKEGKLRIAYMPPATEFNYYIAIGEGIKSVAAGKDLEVFMLAPQSGADINGQMGMIQDVLTQDVDAIIFGTHDEGAAAPLLKQAVDKGVAVVMINSDIPNFPTPIHGVVGYAQRKGTHKIADWAKAKFGDAPVKVGVIEGQPGYHSTERVGGFLDGIKDASNFEVVASIDGKWNVEGGNTAAMDLLQAHPETQLIFAANDYMAIGASYAAKALGRRDLVILGNDGDTSGLEEIAAGNFTATVNTVPFLMGQQAMEATLDALDHKFPGGWVEIPTEIVDGTNVISVLQHPEKLYPKPSKAY
ncbi:sugar ABC transporter substrate-binding protein [Prosthecomicrobium pneumaticum]|uniref:Ribose transport system substrate-binding protein n=1 Tax=Prosthecomicrobium pneumaticum TaxID=81895 RepID=A0A7W9FQV1_9HYPH|nr:sugar ABC transporter substrate-binding protein [Prosthecomicrobium pneumaticum]MBB5755081.1 ribose transport system substrate-binding protein [Prosthecomicrobium pneumaticum]